MADALDKCVVVGIAGLSLELLYAKLHQGKLPALAAVMAAGELRPMVSSVHPRSPAGWASLSTGVGPALHGFVLSEELGPSGRRPAGYMSWRWPPFWERLDQAGLRTASVNWPGAMPGAAWRGAHVDARLGIASGLTREDWPLPLDVSPPSLRAELRSARVHPTEVPRALLLPLDPAGGKLAPESEPKLAEALARLATFQAALNVVSDAGPWDVLSVYQDWLGAVTTALACTAETLPAAAWALLDQSLALAIERASRSSLVIIASIGADGPGFFLARGAGFKSGHRGKPVSTLAVAPTIFHHFGLSAPELTSGLPHPPPALSVLPSPEPRAPSPDPDRSDVARIAAFGCRIRPPDLHWHALRSLAEAELILSNDPAQAAALAEEALIAEPRSLAALGILATSQVALGESRLLPDIARRIAAIQPGHLWEDLVLGAYQALNHDLPAARPHLERVARDGDLNERHRAGTIWLMLDRRAEAARIFRGVLVDQPRHLAALVGLLATETVRGTEAEQLLRRVLEIDPTHSAALTALETLLRSLGRSIEAATLSASAG